MPWVEELLRHDRFLDDLFYKVFRRFEDKDGNKWWANFNDDVEKIDLYKVVFEKGLLVKNDGGYRPSKVAKEGNICITRHMILRRWDNQILGFAQTTGSVKVSTEDIPTDTKSLLDWVSRLYYDLLDYTKLYAYTVDKYTGYTHSVDKDGNISPLVVFSDDSGFGVLRASLDIEYLTEEEYFPEMKQSPIMQMTLADGKTRVASIGKLNYKTDTNWWDDSLIQLRGVFDEYSVFFTLKVDSAPSWDDNRTPVVPFFFGNLVMGGDVPKNKTPIAMFGGTRVDVFFDFDSYEVQSEVIQPLTKNYVHYPSNGIDSIMVKQSKFGARYQAHYLKWNVPPNEMPPTREEIRLFHDTLKGTQADRHIGHILRHKLGKHDQWIDIHDWRGSTDTIQYSKYVLLGDKELCKVEEIDPLNKRIKIKRACESYAFDEETEVSFFLTIEEGIRKYPRAWNYLRKCYYDYQFHPSRYSGKIHTSRAAVVHPEEGTLGYIPNIVLLPLINMMEGDKLRFPYLCEECEEEYYDAVSPDVGEIEKWNPSNLVDGGGETHDNQ